MWEKPLRVRLAMVEPLVCQVRGEPLREPIWGLGLYLLRV